MDLAQNRRHVAQLMKNEAYLMTHDLEQELQNFQQKIEGIKTTMATFQDDEARLEADVAADTNLVNQVQSLVQSNAQQIQTLNTEIADQQAQGADTTRMEAALATLESNNQTLTGLVPAPAQGAAQNASAQAGNGQAAN